MPALNLRLLLCIALLTLSPGIAPARAEDRFRLIPMPDGYKLQTLHSISKSGNRILITVQGKEPDRAPPTVTYLWHNADNSLVPYTLPSQSSALVTANMSGDTTLMAAAVHHQPDSKRLPYLWRNPYQPEPLPMPEGFDAITAIQVSADKTLVLGRIQGPKGIFPILWHLDDNNRISLLQTPGNVRFIDFEGISHDGSTLAGIVLTPIIGYRQERAFTWNQGQGFHYLVPEGRKTLERHLETHKDQYRKIALQWNRGTAPKYPLTNFTLRIDGKKGGATVEQTIGFNAETGFHYQRKTTAFSMQWQQEFIIGIPHNIRITGIDAMNVEAAVLAGTAWLKDTEISAPFVVRLGDGNTTDNL